MSFKEFVGAVSTVGKVFQEREEFLTVRCTIDNEPIDIAFPRAESGYTDQRHPDKVERIGFPAGELNFLVGENTGPSVIQMLKEDASRRDLTINAMFMDASGGIIDFFGGQEDLKNRLIKAVNEPRERFEEDPLRILRAIRFSAKLNFEIESLTWLAMLLKAPTIRTVSVERIREELNGALQANPLRTFTLLQELAIFADLMEKGLTFETTLRKIK